ncbi:TonB-dependent receptor [Kordia algicida OT-1]|uniref:Putative outer membrane protein, probably involved in nutrient binding n=1 Tax=Kordia algicida OT-1 TaxID=391587 RepID=A9E5A1_9FLAO|nr:TonB-dependent receptor [Kordia algicida]EDP95157.1 putative outer membrane protein, probably involved in nutrient binding [Kordia algicida OT-1]
MNRYLIMLSLILSSVWSYGQNLEIRGKVLEEGSNMPLPGVNVLIKNSSQGTATDFDGLFTLKNVPTGSRLVFTSLGYATQEVVVTSSKELTITMSEDSESLESVIVIGYGTQKKKEVTGAVSILDAESIEKLNPVRVEQALQGQVAGVNVTSNSGSPGSGSNIRIRGITTNGDNAPLILVDGNRITDLSVLNPNDIKSINVLKDATAGIYGVQAANGVILITTKSGRKNTELKFQFDSYTGFQTTSKKIDLLTAPDFARYVNDAADATEFFVFPPEGTDWQDEVFENAAISSINFSGNGGTEKAAYGFGISYLNQDGIVGGSKNNFERLTARINFQYDILENLKLTANGLHTISEKQNLQEGGIGAVLYNAVNINPTLAVRDENGAFSLANDISQIEIINPLAQIENTFNTSRVSKFSAVVGLDYTFLKNFKASSKFQINHANVRDDVFRPEVFYGNGKAANFGDITDDNITNFVVDFGADYDDFTWDNYISYNNTFNDAHDLTVLLGTSLYRNKGFFYGFTGMTETGTNQPGQSVTDVGMTAEPRFNAAAIENGAEWFDVRLSSLFSRLQYSYKEKYLLSLVLRRDVSSQFSPVDDNNVGYFPSGSLGWNVSEESFLQEVSWLNNLKLRASYGIIGNDRIPSFAFITRLNGQATIDPGNINQISGLVFGSAPGELGNPNLKWEEQETANLGMDVRLFDNKLNFSADIYRKETKDLLIRPQASAVLGTTAPGSASPIVNAGTVRNQGFEFVIGYNDSFSDDFKFNVSFNLTTIANEVVSLNGRIPPVGGEFGVGLGITDVTRMVPGLPLGHYYGYQTDGLYQTQAEIDALNATAPSGTYSTVGDIVPGDLKFVDINGDGEITPEDRTNLGDPIPNVTMGLNIGFSYKNIDFSANAFASLGNEMVRDYERKDLYANRGVYMLERWQGSGTSNFVPRASSGASINTDIFSDFFVEDASFLRLQNVQVGYTFGDNFISSLGIDKLRVYVSGNNLLTITDYLGYDPSANTGAPLGGAIDKGFYPVASSYLLGINLNF